MPMNLLWNKFAYSINKFNLDNNLMFTESDQSIVLQNGFRIKDSVLNPNVMEPPISPPSPEPSSVACPTSLRSEGDLSDKNDFSDAVLKYISEILMEEDIEEKSCMFNDVLALQAAEKPFYELLGHDYPPSIGYTYSGCDNSNNSSIQSVRVENSFQSSLESDSDLFSRSHPNSRIIVNGPLDSSVSLPAIQNMFSDGISVVKLNKEVDEASKFLPQGNRFVFDLENCPFTSKLKKEAVKLVSKTEKDEKEYSSNKSMGRKNHHHEDIEVDGRSNKQSAIYVEEDELLEIFYKVHVCSVDTEPLPVKGDETNKLQWNQRSTGSHGLRTRNRKRGSKKEVVDLKTLLIQCAKAVAADDRRTANEQLKKIRWHSSALGNADQRLAHYFANALEVRLSGTGNQLYTAPKALAADTYRNYLEICPFKEISVIFANHMILKVAEKAHTLHVIDFGIFYGFQWPILIQSLSRRAGGPPKLRITGIDIPLPGFRPRERVEETGRRLARYCERFNVLFEYNAIAQKWETLQIEDLKIGKEEVLVVNCMFRLEKLLDETIVLRSARNAVINLIRKTNPSLFVQAIVNASYSSPYFVTRFKEAVFHFSALFDMQNSIASLEDQERFMFEKEVYGRWIMNIVACEGTKRVERPEAYKQWVARNTRAGFIQVVFDKELMKKLKDRMKAYHRHFVINEDGGWVLVGWKGRITSATTCWVPA